MSKVGYKVNGKWKTKAVAVVDFLEAPLVRYAIVPLLFYAPVAVVFLYMVESSVQGLLEPVLSQGVIDFLNVYGTLIFILALVANAFFQYAPKLTRGLLESSEYLSIEDALSLLESFQTIVRVKCDRFGSGYKQLGVATSPEHREQVFSTITKPDQQLFSIITALWAWLDKITDDIEFEVRLIESDGKKATSWYTHAPDGCEPREDIEDLNHPNSTVSICIKSNKMVVVPDIEKECKKAFGQRYQMFEEGDEGSILCYPVFHEATKAFPYVISIKASRPNYFSEKKQKLYNWLLKQYSLRINLEHNLRLLKGEV